MLYYKSYHFRYTFSLLHDSEGELVSNNTDKRNFVRNPFSFLNLFGIVEVAINHSR